MGDTTLAGTEGGAHAVEGRITHGPRTQFIADHLRDSRTITELCQLYGVSRKIGYKWIDHYLRLGPAGLEERSRRPHRAPNQTSDELVAAILEARPISPTVQSRLPGARLMLAPSSPPPPASA